MTREVPVPSWPLLEEQALPLKGELLTQGWRIRLGTVNAADIGQGRLYDDPFHAYLNCAALGSKPFLRTRRLGERFQPLGMDGTKKLKEFMIDVHIPQGWRDGVPLVVGKQGVAWVVGWGIAHWARVTPETQEVVEIIVSRQA